MNDHRTIPTFRLVRGLSALALLGAFAASSSAGIVNGTFDAGLGGWTEDGATGWRQEGNPANGYAHFNAASTSLVQKGWQCGDDDEPEDGMDCLITFRYRSQDDALTDSLGVTFGNSGGPQTTVKFKGTDNQWKAGTILSSQCTLKDIKFEQLHFDVDLDDIKDVCVPVVAPEPAAFLPLGLGSLILVRRRRTR